MPHAKSTYYRLNQSGEGEPFVETAVFPSDGDWAAKYAQRGWSLTPPEDAPEEDDAEEDELDDLKPGELKALAAELGVTVSANAHKGDLIETIRTKRLQLEAIKATQN